MTMKCAVLFGGQSHEHPVSLMSATCVIENLDPQKYELYLVGISRQGRWLHYSGPVPAIVNGDWEKDPGNQPVILSADPADHGFYNRTTHTVDRVDVILPMLHGRNGEDGSIQGLAQLSGIPMVSCDMTSSAIAMDKEFTHIIAEAHGVPMARYRVLHRGKQSDPDRLYDQLAAELGLPFYVKPSKEGSSFGAHKVTGRQDFREHLADAFSYDDKVLAEEFIDGREVGCGLLGEGETGVVYEVVVETDMYGYAEKYEGYKTKIYYPAPDLTPQQQQEVVRLGRIVYDALGCKVMGRADFFFTKDGRVVFNEINLIPGFTSHSLYPAMFAHAGVPVGRLLDKMIATVIQED